MRVILALLVAATPAWAQSPPETFHKNQFGLSLRFGIGARGIATYDNTIYCGTVDPKAQYRNASVCSGRTPIAIDLEPSYGITSSIELTLELRIGIERDFGGSPDVDGPRPLHVAPGARFFFSESGRSKLFVQPELLFDFEDFKSASGADRGNDFGFRGLEGFWLDLHHSYGIYFYVAESAEFSRWFLGTFEGGIGFQGRYP